LRKKETSISRRWTSSANSRNDDPHDESPVYPADKRVLKENRKSHACFRAVRHALQLLLHKTIRVTPAMEAGLSDHVWEIEDLLKLFD
jgi:hypothetical protein